MTKVTRTYVGGTGTVIVDENDLPDIMKSLQSLEGWGTEVGVYDQQTFQRGHSHPITMEHLAVILHDGCRIRVTEKMRSYLRSLGFDVSDTLRTIHIPARPFLDVSMNQIEALVLRETALAIDRAVTTAPRSLGQEHVHRVGALVQELLRKVTVDWGTPANHPWTIYLKGENNPLEGTGRLQKYIDYKVERVA